MPDDPYRATIDILRAALELIDTPQRHADWIRQRGPWARTEAGLWVSPLHPHATRWSPIGAIVRAAGRRTGATERAIHHVAIAAVGIPPRRVIGHDESMRILRRVIEDIRAEFAPAYD